MLGRKPSRHFVIIWSQIYRTELDKLHVETMCLVKCLIVKTGSCMFVSDMQAKIELSNDVVIRTGVSSLATV